MGYVLEKETFNIQNVVTNDVYSPDKSLVAGTIGDVFAMGTILVHDRTLTAPAWRLAVAADIPVTTAALSLATPMLAIVKNEFKLITVLDTVGGIMTMGEAHRPLTNLASLTAKTEDAEYCMNKTGLYLIGN